MKSEKRSVCTGLTARVEPFNGRPMLFVNGEPTTECWCYGDPNAIADFASGGIRIRQFHVPFPSWWTGPQRYDFRPTDEKIEEFCAQAESILLMPRVNFGYVGEEWWGEGHPDELAVGVDPDFEANKPRFYITSDSSSGEPGMGAAGSRPCG